MNQKIRALVSRGGGTFVLLGLSLLLLYAAVAALRGGSSYVITEMGVGAARPFIEQLGAPRVIYDARSDFARFLREAREGKAKAFPHLRIYSDYRSYGETIPVRMKNEKLALGKLLQDEGEDGVLHRPVHRSQLYYSNLIDKTALPYVAVRQGDYLTFEITHQIVRSPENEREAAIHGRFLHRIRIIWCDKERRALRAKKPFIIKLFTDHSNQWVTDRVENVDVPRGAAGLRLDVQLPVVDSVLYRDIRVLETSSERKFGARAFVESVKKGHAVTRRASFPAINGPANRALVARGVSFGIDDVWSVSYLTSSHKLATLGYDQACVLGAFAPHTFVVELVGGKRLSFVTSGVELIRLRRRLLHLYVDLYVYSAGERRYRRIGDVKADGTRVNTDLAITPVMESQRMSVSMVPADRMVLRVWQPQGRLATLVFTEHADRQTADTDAIVMYGNRQEKRMAGVGIFGNSIPYTKSVFAFTNSENYKQESLEQPEFRALIQRYIKRREHIELGLHTASPGSDDLARTRAALKEVATLGGRIWIDHSDSTNLDDLERLGGDRSNPDYYLVPSLREFGFNIAWSYRDFETKGLNDIADDEASNLLFYVPALDDDLSDGWRLHLFSTRRVVFKPDTFSQHAVDELISEHGISLIHCYFSFNRFGHIVEKNGQPVGLAPWFNEGLQRLAAARDRGDLWIPTIGEWSDYVLAMRNAEIRYTDDGVIVSSPTKLRSAGLGFRTASGSTQIVASVAAGHPVKARSKRGVLYLWTDVRSDGTRIKLK